MKNSRLVLILSLILISTVLIFVGKYYYDKSFSGDEDILLITDSNQIKTLEDLISRKEFANSVLYIDIWGTSCIPCINEFKYASQLKERYRRKPIKFIYLSAPYLHFYDEVKWKNMIREHNLAGFHSLISVEFYDNIMKREGIEMPYAIPHYILVDKQGRITELNAKRPSNEDELYSQIDRLL